MRAFLDYLRLSIHQVVLKHGLPIGCIENISEGGIECGYQERENSQVGDPPARIKY